MISGNTGNGITLGPDTTSTQILNNLIGFGIDGTTLVPNTGAPIVENGSVGNTISGNQIAPGQPVQTGGDGGDTSTTPDVTSDPGDMVAIGSDMCPASCGFLYPDGGCATGDIPGACSLDAGGTSDIRTIVRAHENLGGFDANHGHMFDMPGPARTSAWGFADQGHGCAVGTAYDGGTLQSYLSCLTTAT